MGKKAPVCPLHNVKRARTLRTEGDRSNYTYQWSKLRARILYAEPWCRVCERAIAVEVDHIKPLEQGGELMDPDNCQPICKACHVEKSTREARERAARRRKK